MSARPHGRRRGLPPALDRRQKSLADMSVTAFEREARAAGATYLTNVESHEVARAAVRMLDPSACVSSCVAGVRGFTRSRCEALISPRVVNINRE